MFVGADAAEVWTDSRQHNADVRCYFDGSVGVNHWIAGEILARATGDLGWTFDQPTLRLADGSEFRLRVSLFWGRTHDGWKVLHSHASVGQ